MKVHCKTCDSMVPAEGVHSCFDAAMVKQSEAEVAVIEAADRWSRRDGDCMHLNVELALACAKLRAVKEGA